MSKPNPQVYFVTIDEELDGQRIDNFLIAQLKGVPKSHIYRILRKGEVRVNKCRKKAQYRLKCGDMVRIPPIRVAEPTDEPIAKPGLISRLEEAIIFEDDRFIVINKPTGFAVHGGSGIQLGVIETFRQSRPEAKYLELVHRIDRETSGCLILAKKRSALTMIQEQLRQNRWKKEYLAVIRGRWHGGQRTIDAPLLKNTIRSGERVVRVSPEGKKALSQISPVYVTDACSLVKVKLLTGRTHQIRVHCAHVNQPIAGDQRYGDAVFNRSVKAMGLKRMFLHAYSVEVQLPEIHQHIKVSAPLDDELTRYLRSIGFKSDVE